VSDRLEAVVEALLWEGYALYPYTPEATKNATPTPFGIVYPPSYAGAVPGALDVLQVECVAEAGGDARVDVDVRFLQSTGPRHEAVERRLALSSDEPVARFALPPIAGRATLQVAPPEGGMRRVTARVENRTPVAPGADRPEALRHALLSTHVVVRVAPGRFISPLEDAGPAGEAVAACSNVNTWPVLASPEDDVILSAAMVLPDHPELAPESGGGLFDGTEIEEALLLHVRALSDAERASIAAGDPAVRAMIERAERATPEELLRLHGRLRMEGDDAPP
jgi:hypothetical protein